MHPPVLESVHPVGNLGEVVYTLRLLHRVERAVVGSCVNVQIYRVDLGWVDFRLSVPPSFLTA